MQVQDFIASLFGHISEHDYQIPHDSDLVLQLEEDTEEAGYYDWCYYFACHTSRSLFWVHEHDITSEIDNVLGTVSPSHLKHELEFWYWSHCARFPHAQPFSKEIVEEVTSILVRSTASRVLFASSIVHMPEDKLQVLLNIVECISSTQIEWNDEIKVTVSAMLAAFAHAHFVNYHGQLGARLSVNQAMYSESNTLWISFLNFIFSIMFFSMPQTFVTSFANLSVGSWISYLSCYQFTQEVQSKWRDFIVIATVLLTTNVAFLAIPGVDSGTDKRTPAQIVSYISTIMSMNCIISGGLLLHLIHPDVLTFVEDVWYYPKTNTSRLSLAVLYSIPYASLCWGFITFLLAFLIECFDTQDHTAIFLVAIALGLLVILTAWHIYVKSVPEALSKSILYQLHHFIKDILQLLLKYCHSFIHHFLSILHSQPHTSFPLHTTTSATV